MRIKNYSLFLFLLFLSLPEIALSATFYSRTNGNWNTSTTWSLTSCSGASAGSVPSAADNVIICAGRTVTMNGMPGSCLSLTVNGTANWTSTAAITNVGSGGLTLNNGSSLTGSVAGTLNISGPTTVSSGATTTIGGISFAANGVATISGTVNWNNTAGGKTLSDLIISPGAVWNNSSAENFTISGDFQNNGTFTSSTFGVYTFSGTGKALSGSSATTIARITCSGSYTNNLTLTVSSRLAGSGSFTQGATGVLNLPIRSNRFSVAIFNASTPGNSVNYNRTAGGFAGGFQNIRTPSDGSYANLTISGNGTKTLLGNTILNGTLLISAATLSSNNFNINVGGDFTNNSAFSAGTGRVTLDGIAAQTIGGTASTGFNNLTISNNSAIVSASTNLSVSNTLNVGAGAILSPAASVIVSGTGTLTGNGTVRVTRISATPDFISQYTIAGKTLAGLNVDFIGAGNQNVNILNYGSLTISTNGSRTVTFPSGIVGVSNVFSPTAVTTTYVITNNTVNFNGTLAQTIPVFNYNNLTSSSTGTRTLASAGIIGVAGVFTPGSNSYTITGSTINYNGTVAQSVAAFNYFNLTSSSTGSRTLASAGTIGVASIFTPGTNAYTITGSTVDFNGTIAQSVPVFNYNNITTSGSSAKVLAGNITVDGNITITSNLDVSSSNYSISVKGNWIKNGTFSAQSGNVIFNGSAAQTLSGTGITTFHGLSINNTGGGVQLTSGAYLLNSFIDPLSGNFNTNGQSFTMVSDASKTARIGQLGAGASLSGNFIVQRYITARDTSYSDLCSTVQGAAISDWGNELPALSYIYSPPTALPSAYTYDETADVYVPVTSASTSLDPGKGYEVFLSGSFTYSSFPNTTMDVVGVPNQGTHDLSGLVSNNVQGWNLVGNPFASNISWASVYAASGGASSGLYDYVEMYDYTIGDWNGYTSGSGIEIGSAQGFWVYGLPGATGLTLVIPESSKTTSSNSSIKSFAKAQPYFTLNISNDQNAFSHTFKVMASADAENGIDSKDIPFRSSPNKATPQLYGMVEGKKMNVNAFDPASENYSISLQTPAANNGIYKIEAGGYEFIPEYNCIQLEDKFRNKFIDLKNQNSYSFGMAAGDGPDRFILHLSKSGVCKTGAASLMEDNSTIEDHVSISSLPEGNLINFNFDETTEVSLEVTNLLGQKIVETKTLSIYDSSEKIVLPNGFTGIYLIRISSEKGTMIRKFYK